MVAKKETNTNASNNVMEFFMKDWWNQVDSIEEMEQKSVQVIKNQKEWIEGTKEQFTQFEENSKKLTSEWKTTAQSFFDNYSKDMDGQNYQEWLNKFEEIGHKTQTIVALPTKTSFEILARTNDQFEEMFVKAIDQNKKMREETSKAYEGAMDQYKQFQEGMFKFFDPRTLMSK